jgi:hypothetical protein
MPLFGFGATIYRITLPLGAPGEIILQKALDNPIFLCYDKKAVNSKAPH